MPLSSQVINGNLSCTKISRPGDAPGGFCWGDQSPAPFQRRMTGLAAGLNDPLILVAPVQGIAGEGPGILAGNADECAEAVVLDLVNPPAIREWLSGEYELF